MLVDILVSIPPWVLPLFLGLLVLGGRATQDRQAPVLLIYALPLLGVIPLSTARGLVQGEVALIALSLGYLSGAMGSYLLQGKWIVSRSARHVALRGEWATMVTVMGLFFMGFSVGMAKGLAPDLASGVRFATGYGLLSGLFSGSLAGRALRVARTPKSCSTQSSGDGSVGV